MSTELKNRLEYSGSEYRQLDLVESILDTVTEGVAFGNTKGELILFNSKATELLGRQLTRLPPESWGEHYGLFYEDAVTPLPIDMLPMVRAIRGDNFNNEIFFVRNEAKPEGIFILTDGRALLDKSNKIYGGVVIFRDYTHRKMLQAESEASKVYLQQAKDAAEYANRAKSEFLANISHEIRTPLTAILGFTDMFVSSMKLNNSQNIWLETVNRNCQHLLTLVNNVLDLVKIESEEIVLEKGTFSLSDIILSAFATVTPLAIEKKIKLDLNMSPDVPSEFQFYPTAVRQILINLLGNAVKFTDQGVIDVSISYRSGLVNINIRDQGIGISLDDQKNLFQPFCQALGTGSRKLGGTGLGLALSRRIARAFGGDVELVSSVLGVGSKFRLSFRPEVIDRSSTEHLSGAKTKTFRRLPSQKERIGNISLKDMSILLVEDTLDNQILFKYFLESAGANVEVASDGFGGIETALGENFDVVLLDIQLPDINGYEVTRRLRSNNYDRPIIALTANVLDGEFDRCLDAGCDDYLSKPVDPNVLIRTVDKYRDANRTAISRH